MHLADIDMESGRHGSSGPIVLQNLVIKSQSLNHIHLETTKDKVMNSLIQTLKVGSQRIIRTLTKSWIILELPSRIGPNSTDLS